MIRQIYIFLDFKVPRRNEGPSPQKHNQMHEVTHQDEENEKEKIYRLEIYPRNSNQTLIQK